MILAMTCCMRHLPFQLSLVLSTLFYFSSCLSSLLGFRSRGLRPGRFDWMVIALGVLAQSWFLMTQGAMEHACPIRTLPEVMIFLSWAIGLFYLVVGTTYRISLMGAFSAPLILALQSIALLLPGAKMPLESSINPWIELHAALSLIAFGAFGLASISAIMFLVQEKQLKSQHPTTIFHYLPPMRLLEAVTLRLLWLGWVLLSISFAAGWLPSHSISGMKFGISLLVWGSYVLTLFLYHKHRVGAHHLALMAILIFFFALMIFPVMRYISGLYF